MENTEASESTVHAIVITSKLHIMRTK